MKETPGKHIPQKTIGFRQKIPGLTTPLRTMCKKKGRLHSKVKKGNAHWQQFVDYQRTSQCALNRAHWQYVNGTLAQGIEHGDQKPFWRYICNQKQDN